MKGIVKTFLASELHVYNGDPPYSEYFITALNSLDPAC